MKRVFLTGASSGIGLAIAKSLSARGDEVWGTSRDPARIPQLPRLHPVRLDLLDASSIEHAFQGALSEAGDFDVVINNAGSGHFDAAEHLSDNEIEKQFQILVFGHLQLMRPALAAMRARGGPAGRRLACRRGASASASASAPAAPLLGIGGGGGSSWVAGGTTTRSMATLAVWRCVASRCGFPSCIIPETICGRVRPNPHPSQRHSAFPKCGTGSQ